MPWKSPEQWQPLEMCNRWNTASFHFTSVRVTNSWISFPSSLLPVDYINYNFLLYIPILLYFLGIVCVDRCFWNLTLQSLTWNIRKGFTAIWCANYCVGSHYTSWCNCGFTTNQRVTSRHLDLTCTLASLDVLITVTMRLGFLTLPIIRNLGFSPCRHYRALNTFTDQQRPQMRS